MPCYFFGIQSDPCGVVFDEAWDIGMVQRLTLQMAATSHRLKQWTVADPRRIKPHLKTVDGPDNTAVQDRDPLSFTLLIRFGSADGKEHALISFLCGFKELNILYSQAAYLRASQSTRETEGNNRCVAPSDDRISTLSKHGLNMVLSQCFYSTTRGPFEPG